MEINKLKKLERIKYKLISEKSTQKEKENVVKNVEEYLSNFYKRNKHKNQIAIYWPIRNEIDIRTLKNNYSCALPKCLPGKKLEFYIWDKNPLENDLEGIPAPTNNKLLNYQEISIIFVPCLSVDRKLTRLGYGGGYFDKLREKCEWHSIPCIGILTSRCVSKNLLIKSEWDIPLSGYITDKEIFV